MRIKTTDEKIKSINAVNSLLAFIIVLMFGFYVNDIKNLKDEINALKANIINLESKIKD